MIPRQGRARIRCGSARASTTQLGQRPTTRATRGPSTTMVQRTLAEEALCKGWPQSETTSGGPFPLGAWPDVPTAAILCRHDRLFPVAWLR
jgi:hypothetical protein